MLIMAAYNQWSLLVSYFMAEWSKLMACNITGACWDNLISLYQSALLFLCYFFLLHEYLYFERKNFGKEFKQHIIHYVAFMVFFAATIPAFVVPGIKAGSCNTTYQVFALGFVIVSSVISALEWIPQILMTYRLKAVGSMSLLAMLIQCPGCAVSLVVTIFSHNPWYTWISWLVSFTLELVLVCLLIRYTLQARKRTHPIEVSQDEHSACLEIPSDRVQ